MIQDSKHIVVSGGGSGVGAEIAARFATQGHRVSILGRRQSALDDVAAQIGAFAAVCDVTNRASLDTALARTVAQNGPVDIAVANAGAVTSMPFAKMTPDDLEAMLSVNLLGVFNLWQAVLPGMTDQGWGRMIAIASTAGLKGYPYVSGYCAAKHGVVGLTRALSIELARKGITVNAICPGFIETPLLKRSIDTIAKKTGMSAKDAAASLRSANPQDRFVQPNEVAAAVQWLTSEAAKSVNGAIIPISGGEI